jgi:protein-tyrosine phosphatase
MRVLDLHCHILPGVDDGAASLDESLEMARFCAGDGITHIVATPHCHRHCRMLRADILPHVARLNEAFLEARVPLVVLPGSEIQCTDTAAYRREFEAGLYCHLGDRPAFTLLEFNWKPEQYPADAPELVDWLVRRGTTPIIAHPERHGFFAEDPARLAALVAAGAWLQVTVDSLLGNHGPAPRAAGESLLRQYPDAVLATDAHNRRRCSGLSAGYTWVQQWLGAECVARLQGAVARVFSAIAPEVELPAAPDPAG